MHNLSSVKAVFDQHTTSHDPTKHRKSVMKTESIAKSRTSSFPKATNANSAHSRGYPQTSDRKRGYDHASVGKQENKQRSSVTDLGNFKRRKVEHSSKTQHSRQSLVPATSKAPSAAKEAVNISPPLEPTRKKAGPFNMEDSDEDNDDDVVITDHRVIDHGPVVPKTIPPAVPQQDVTNTKEAQRAQSRRLREESLFKKLGGLRAEEKQLEPEVDIVSVSSQTDTSSKTPTTNCERLERAGPSSMQVPKNCASQLDTSRNRASPSHLVSSIPSKANLKPESIDLTDMNSETTTAKHHFKRPSSGKVSGRSRREGVEDIKGSLLQDAHSNGRVSSQNVARSNDHELEKNPASHAVTALGQRNDVELDRDQSPKTSEEANGGEKEPLWHEQLQSNLRKMQEEKELQAERRAARLAHAESQKREQERQEHERRRIEAESLRRKQREAKQKQEQEDREAAEERRQKQEQMRLAVLQQHEEERREHEERDALISNRNAEQAAVRAAEKQAADKAEAEERRRRQIHEAENRQCERDEGLLEVVSTNEAAIDRPIERSRPPNKPLSQITRDVFGVQTAQSESGSARQPSEASHGSGPRSLNSTSGQAAISSDQSKGGHAATANAGDTAIAHDFSRKPHQRALGEIKQEDALLVRLKHDGCEWPAIAKSYTATTGQVRAITTLRDRCNTVSKALQTAGVGEGLVKQLAEGDADAERQINSFVRDNLSFPAITKPHPESSHDRALGEIRRDDAMLISLRDGGNDWSAIIKSLEKATGKGKTESTLRRRYNKVSQALQAANVSDHLIKRFADGNQEAGKQINTRVQEIPLPNIDAPRADTSPELKYQEDANIYIWREKEALLYPEIVEWYQKMTGKTASTEALRKRYQKMRDAVQAQKLSMADVQKIANDYPEKLQKPKEPSKAASPTPPRSSDALDQSQTANVESDTRDPASAQGHRTLPAQHPPAAQPSAQFITPPSSFSEDQAAETLPHTARPTTGGKTMNTQTAFYLLESQRQTWQAMDEEKQAQAIQSTQQSDSDHDDDEYYFVYRLYRRDTDIAHPENDEDDDWIECDDTYSDLLEANEAARKEVVRALPRHHLYDSVEHTYSCRVREDDMQIHTLELSGMRRVEVAVDRVMKRDAERMLPRRRWDGISVIGYVVRERVSANEEASQPSIERCVGNSTYTALELANDAAVKYWVEKTFTSESTKLHVRDTERMEMQGNLLEGLEDGEMFEAEGEDTDGRVVKVWVEVSRLVGPRNI